MYDSEPRVHSEGRPAAGRGVDAARQHDGDAAGGNVAGGEEAAAEDDGGQEGGRAQEARFGNILHTTGYYIIVGTAGFNSLNIMKQHTG